MTSFVEFMSTELVHLNTGGGTMCWPGVRIRLRVEARIQRGQVDRIRMPQCDNHVISGRGELSCCLPRVRITMATIKQRTCMATGRKDMGVCPKDERYYMQPATAMPPMLCSAAIVCFCRQTSNSLSNLTSFHCTFSRRTFFDTFFEL